MKLFEALADGAGMSLAGVWDSEGSYSVGDVVIDRGGVWQAVYPNGGSRPVSGNSDWILVGGESYTEVQLAGLEVPIEGAILIPSPGAGAFLVPTRWSILGDDDTATLGSSWGSGEEVFVQDNDVGYTFTGGRFNYTNPALGQEFTSPSPMDSAFRLFMTSLGRLGSVGLFAAGTGYAAGDTVKDPFNGELLVTVDTVGGGGEVLTFTVTALGTESDWLQGENDLVMVNTAPQSGVGTGFTLEVTALSPVATDAVLRTWYSIVYP